MIRFVRSALVMAGLVATAALSACSDATEPAPARALGPTPRSAYFAQGSLVVTPDTLTFGTVLLGQESAPMSVTLRNAGTVALSLWDESLIGPGDFYQVTGGNDCVLNQAMQPGDQCTLSYVFKPIAGGARSSYVMLQSDGGSVNLQLRGTSYTDADMAVRIAANPTTVQVGKPLTYTVTLKNLGPGNATGITMSDVLPPMTTFQSISASTKTLPCTTPAVGSTGTVSCDFSWMPAGYELTYTLVVNVPTGGRIPSISNTATVSTTSADAVKSNDSATITIQARGKK